MIQKKLLEKLDTQGLDAAVNLCHVRGTLTTMAKKDKTLQDKSDKLNKIIEEYHDLMASITAE